MSRRGYDGQIRLHYGLNGARDTAIFFNFFKFGMSDGWR